MDAGASQSPLDAKTQKLFGGEDVSQDKDVISRLPEEILVRILSFLSTKEAIKTSILSKKWKYLWVFIPNFSFRDSFEWSLTKRNDKILELQASFLNSIENALLLRNTSCLGNFNLSLTVHVGASRLHSWLSTAIKHNVRQLYLYLPYQRKFIVPSSVFTSKSLSFLSLDVRSTLKVPSFICFSGLKDLDLADVGFQDDQSAQQLFSGCPLLENLRLHNCHWEYIKEITIEIPSLRSLVFSDRRFPPHRLLNGKIIISALNLETLEVRSFLSVEVFPCNLQSLTSARVDIYKWNGRQEHINRVVTLLSGLHNVKSLYLSSGTLEPLLIAENVEGLLPMFHNLTEFYGFVEHPLVCGKYYASRALVYILQKSPNVEVLVLPRAFRLEELDMVLGTVPHCFQTSLKSFMLFNVDGYAEDLFLLEHVWENAPFLERLTINCALELSKDLAEQQEICQQLRQLCVGAAASCLIDFYPYDNPSTW